MARTTTFEKIGALIDHIEQIRDQLLSVQHSLEKLEAAKSAKQMSPGGHNNDSKRTKTKIGVNEQNSREHSGLRMRCSGLHVAKRPRIEK
jgi:hypothetical protein